MAIKRHKVITGRRYDYREAHSDHKGTKDDHRETQNDDKEKKTTLKS